MPGGEKRLKSIIGSDFQMEIIQGLLPALRQ